MTGDHGHPEPPRSPHGDPGTRARHGSARVVACFDFDRTVSTRDNLLPFLRVAAGTARLVGALGRAAPVLARARHDPSRRDAAKAVVLAHTLAGRDLASLRDLGERFARLVVTRHLNPAVMRRLHVHRAAGHDLVIVSASLTLYLEPIAARLRVPTVLATEMEVGPDGRLTGALRGRNVRGPEKVRRLDEWLAGEPARVFAYGDGDGDRELLARADHGVWVDRRGRIRDRDPHGPARLHVPDLGTHFGAGGATNLR